MIEGIISVLIAVLIAASATAQTPKAELPDEMLGSWCGQWGWQFPDDDADHWWRTDDVESCGNRGVAP